MLEVMNSSDRNKYELIAMCFPTPRDTITDRAKKVFHGHLNLYSHNRYVVIFFCTYQFYIVNLILLFCY